MTMYRRLLSVCAALAATVAMSVVVAQPAAAASFACTTSGGSQVCIDVFSDGVFADVEVITDVNFHSVTVAALQCSGTGSNCGTIAARSDVGHLWTFFATSTKPFSLGHTYKAVASWTDPAGVRHTAIGTPLACCP